MTIAIGSDHAGYALKLELVKYLRNSGYEVRDFGADGPESTDYPDYAFAVSRSVASGEAERGVLVCSTGVGMSIAANKVPGIRAALATHPEEVRLTRGHNDANVLTFGARFSDESSVRQMLDIFLATPFEGGRHARRLQKIANMESDSAAQSTAGASGKG